MLILHVGRHKTGTSSIQHFLHANRQELKKLGIIYPEPVGAVAAHHGIALAMAGEQDITEFQSLLATLKPLKYNVVLSSEGFQSVRPRQMKQLVAGYRGHVKTVAYLREQFSNAWAAYSQNILANLHTAPFETALPEYRPKYRNFLKRTAHAVGAKPVVRIFDQKKLIGGDVVVDFCEAVLGIDASKFPPAKVMNETLGWRAVNFARVVNTRIAGHPNALLIKRHLLDGLRAVSAVDSKLKEKPIFPRELIEQYQAHFVEENRQIAEEYFGSNEPLFDLSWRGDSNWNPGEGLTTDQVDALFESCPPLRPFDKAIGFPREPRSFIRVGYDRILQRFASLRRGSHCW